MYTFYVQSGVEARTSSDASIITLLMVASLACVTVLDREAFVDRMH